METRTKGRPILKKTEISIHLSWPNIFGVGKVLKPAALLLFFRVYFTGLSKKATCVPRFSLPYQMKR